MKKNLTIIALLLVIVAGWVSQASAQRTLISSRNYFGIEVGANYGWAMGSNFYFPYGYNLTDPFVAAPIERMPLSSPGAGLGALAGVTLDLSLTDQFALFGKLHYRAHSTSKTETVDEAVVTWDTPTGVETATEDVENENHFETSTSYVGVDIGLRFQFVPESWYGLLGFSFSSLLSDEISGYRRLGGDGSITWPNYSSRSLSGETEITIPAQTSNNYFNESQFHIKLGAGTFIPLGGSGWVLTPELNVAIPMTDWVASNFAANYEANDASVPKFWYAALSVALKFPFGGSSYGTSSSSSSSSGVTNTPGKRTIRGRVIDGATGEPVDADITVINLDDNQVVAETETDSDGEYEVEVDAPGRYSVTADADGYLFGSQYIIVDADGNTSVGKGDIKLSKSTGGRVRLLVFFDFNKADLQRSSYPELDRAVRLMKANPSMEVEIAGYTDNVGADNYNLDLSQRRANTVRDYLVTKGVAASRLTAVGYGKANPVSSNDSEDGRADNRRVEFVVKRQ